MPRTIRIGVQVQDADPFWVQVHEAIFQRLGDLGLDIIPLDVHDVHALPVGEHQGLIEEVLAQEIDAVICLDWPDDLTRQALQVGIPVIQCAESNLRHPLFVAPHGLYDIARELGGFLARQLAGRGRVLAVGGQMAGLGEDGRSRVEGLAEALRGYPDITWRHLPCFWDSASAIAQLRAQTWAPGERFDALFGFSDSLALAAQETARELGILAPDAKVVGINGDPLALAAILDGRMLATVETSATDLAVQVVDAAFGASRRQRLPDHLSFTPRFVTAENVNEVAAQKLIAIARLPSRLIGDNNRQAQQRLSQLEISLGINQHVGALLDRRQLAYEIANLIRVSYGYEIVQVCLWDPAAGRLTLEGAEAAGQGPVIPPDEAGVLAEALQGDQPLFVADALHSHRFPPDPAWPETRSRVVVPVRIGNTALGLIDLHSRAPRQHARQDLVGLQSLANHMGIALRNAELVSEAVEARASAESADQIKTRLLANVSHELRTPLNVILGYASAAAAQPNPYQTQLPDALRGDLRQIMASGEHLLRVINDLLDLSRAEINALDLFPEVIDLQALMAEVFETISGGLPAKPGLGWRLQLPEHLPQMRADPVRLRQILYNLLNNAYKFTSQGEIVLGAETATGQVRVWVRDTGIGIPPELQERIFEPFATSLQARRRDEGVGLGLTVTRRLVMLHGGTLSVASEPGRGSTFTFNLPLPDLSERSTPVESRQVLAAITAAAEPSAAIHEMGLRQGWTVECVRAGADLHARLLSLQPSALAWDLPGAAPEDWGVVQQVRSMPQWAHLPFIIYDGGGAVLGPIDILAKPVGQQALLDELNALRPAAEAGPLLVVDDDPRALDLHARLLAQVLPGHTVLTAEDGAAALRKLDEAVPSLIILDLNMPNVDGFTVLEAVRARPATRHVPVVIMSGRSLTPDDMRRLDHLYVTFQSKGLLSASEAAEAFRRAYNASEVLPPQTSLAVKQAVAYLQTNHERTISRGELASAVGVSKDYLSHIFRQEIGLTPWEYLARYRIQRAKTLLRESRASITAIAAQVGFDDLSYFNRVFRKQVGCSPGAYREGEPGAS